MKGLDTLNNVIANYNEMVVDCPDTFNPFTIDVIFLLIDSPSIATFIESIYPNDKGQSEIISLKRIKQMVCKNYDPVQNLFELRNELIQMDDNNQLHLYQFDRKKEAFKHTKTTL